MGRSLLLQTTVYLPEKIGRAVKQIRKTIADLALQGNLDPNNDEIASQIEGLEPKEIAGTRWIAKHLKSGEILTGCEDWAVIMADPIEAPQIELLFS